MHKIKIESRTDNGVSNVWKIWGVGTQGREYFGENLGNKVCAHTTFWSETQVFVPHF